MKWVFAALWTAHLAAAVPTESSFRCADLDLSSLGKKLRARTARLYPEHADELRRRLDNAEAKRLSAPAAACVDYSAVRISLSRHLGPRVLTDRAPDPVVYPKARPHCVDAQHDGPIVEAALRKQHDFLYPRVRARMKGLLEQAAGASDARKACAVYDEIRNYLLDLDLWPK